MACKYKFLSGAAQEYENIISYFVESCSNVSAANLFINEFRKQINLICENPRMYPLSRFEELARLGYRLALVNNYAFLYFYRDDIIYIAHVFHQKQNYIRFL